jgi:hypothetical protein
VKCPTCGTIGVAGSICAVCDTRLPRQAAPGGAPAPRSQKPRARPGTLGAFIAGTLPAQLAPRRRPSAPVQQGWSQVPAAPEQQQGWSQGPVAPPHLGPHDWSPSPIAPQGPPPATSLPAGFPAAGFSGYPGARQASPFSPFATSAAQPSMTGAPQGQRLTSAPDVVGVSNGGRGPVRLTLNALVVCVVLALVGIPILFGLQRLNAANSAPQATRIAATRIPTAVPPSGMLGLLGDHLSIAYPSAWTHRHQTRGTAYGNAQVETFSQDAGTYVDVFTVPSIPSDLLETGIDSVGESGLGGAVPQPTTTNKRVAYNSVQWMEDDFTVSLVVDGHETPEQMRVLGVNEGLDTFVVVLVAPRSSSDATNTGTFEPMLQSLRLG